MAIHFKPEEYDERMNRLCAAMESRSLDCMLLFAQESMYWLTGYDTFGYCFFQCLAVKRDGSMALLTRAPDLRQARHTSIIREIAVWADRSEHDPSAELLDLLASLDLVGARFGVEFETAGLNAANGFRVTERLRGFGEAEDASDLVPLLRAVKSKAEMNMVRKAASLADDAFDAALERIEPGANEGEILAAMHSAIFSAGGDYPGNEFIIGSGRDALLCRHKSGRRKLSRRDQLTLEWAGSWAHYHSAMMRTVLIGKPTSRHEELYEVAREALVRCSEMLRPGVSFGEVFDVHARAMDEAGMARHRMNACGYSLGASFSPCWMDKPMIYAGNPALIEPNMVLFLHMIIADSESETAMTLGQTYATGEEEPKDLSRHGIDLISV